jgi:hypothetical protein
MDPPLPRGRLPNRPRGVDRTIVKQRLISNIIRSILGFFLVLIVLPGSIRVFAVYAGE